MEVVEGLEEIRKLKPKTSRIFDAKLGKNGLWVKYLHLYCGFDIETTTIEDRAYMWIWQFSICDDSTKPLVITGRTWGEFSYFIGKLKRQLNLRETTRVIIWIANTSFEFGFIQHLFEWDDLFAKEKRQPLYFRTGGVEFREALTISGGGLAYLAKTYCTTQKMTGDLDFSKLRNSKTPFTEIEKQYIYNDVIILSEFSQYIFREYIDKDKYIPLTSTSILRHELKEKAAASVRDINALYAEIKAMHPKTRNDYLLVMQYLFRGGYVHGRYSAMLQTLYNLDGYDLKSSYPSQILKQYYSVTPYEEYRPKDYKDFKRCLKEYCCIMIIRLKGVESKTAHTIESKNKCIDLINPVIDNGRVRACDSMVVMISEKTYEIYDKFYKWESYDLISFQIAKRGNLPPYLLELVYKYFSLKEQIDKEAEPQAYAISKTRANGCFGLTCTRLQFADVAYNRHEWGLVENDKSYEEMISKQVLSCYWGVEIADWGRYEILNLLYEIQSTVYIDTDSLKFEQTPETMEIVKRYNERQIAMNEKCCKKYGFSMDVIGKLGTLEHETSDSEKGKILRFRGAGAKRYICEYANKGFESTIAGLGKKALAKYAKAINKDPFLLFDNEMAIPAEYTEKLRPKYNDSEHWDIVCDEYGNIEKMHSESSVALMPVEFTMGLEKDYIALLYYWLERKKRHGN